MGFVESVGSAGEGTVCTDGIEYSGKEAVCEMEGDVHVRRGFMCIRVFAFAQVLGRLANKCADLRVCAQVKGPMCRSGACV